MKITILQGHAIETLKTLPADSIQCCVTSPPYWGLRDYGLEPLVWGGREDCRHEWGPDIPQDSRHRYNKENSGKKQTAAEEYPKGKGQWCYVCGAWRGALGLEPTIDLYIAHMVEIFREVRRVLRPDGTLFLNIGDSYMGSGGAGGDYGPGGLREGQPKYPGRHGNGLKAKDLCGIPWRVALALQADGWWLRSDIIWAKPNPMPESCTDRPTKSHEYIFLLTKSGKYFWDQEAVKEVGSESSHGGAPLYGGGPKQEALGQQQGGCLGVPAKRKSKAPDGWATHAGGHGSIHREGREKGKPGLIQNGRNLRTVWTLATEAFPEAHFATFPQRLVERCIKAGTSEYGCCGAMVKKLKVRDDLTPEEAQKVEAFLSSKGWL